MPKQKVRVTFNQAAAAATVRAACKRALVIAGNQAMEDVNQYVPEDQGTLLNTGISNSTVSPDGLSFILRWDTPYAQYLYRGIKMVGTPDEREYDENQPLKFTKAMACAEWARHAKKVHGKDWKKIYEKAMKEGIQWLQ